MTLTAEAITSESRLVKKQTMELGPRLIVYHGEKASITVKVRYDDECGNGHNSFAITAEIRSLDKRRNRSSDGIIACGCLHDEIARVFPSLAPLLKWHLCSSDGPLYYVADTAYNASDKDYNGHRAGDANSFSHGVRFSFSPVTHRISKKFYEFLVGRYHVERYQPGMFQVVEVNHDRDAELYSANYTFAIKARGVVESFGSKWSECPFQDRTEAEEFAQALNYCKVTFVEVPTGWSKGKQRELDAARRSAVWLDATDEELIAPGLEDRLMARLPKLLAEFRADVEKLGLVW